MQFTQDLTPNVNRIRAYGPGELRINDDIFHATVIVGPSVILAEPGLASVKDLAAEHVARILALDPELVLIGTGVRQDFPAAAFGARFLGAGIGFDVMNTGAACRTFNVLVSEHRRVIALLIP